MRCSAHTRAGGRCRRNAMAGGDRCHAHCGEAVGRPEKLTEELARRLFEAVRAGVTKEVAADFARISRSTLHRWLARGKDDGPDSRYRDLAQDLRRAEAEAEVR